MRSLLVATLLFLAASAPARADHQQPLVSPEAFLGGIVQDSDVSLLFSYVRQAFRAALRGHEAPPPHELQERAEVIGEEIRRRGAIAGERVLDEIERTIREEMRQAPRVPPSPHRQWL